MTPVDDVPALTAALNRVRTDENLRRTLAQNGKAHYLQAFDKQAILSQWQNLFQAAGKN
jgi:glycosyltransferase involved in cell wall biosynthesis